MWVSAKDYRTADPIRVRFEGGTVCEIAPATADALEAGWLAPAFFDVQINGCLGHSFNSPDLTTDAVAVVVAECLAHGIGTFCPTLVTASFDALRHGFATLARAAGERIPLFHLEGPYLAGDDGPRGAHPREHIRPPDWVEFQRLQEAAEGRIGMVTLAPEYEGALDFIEALRQANVVPAIGHTAATPARIRDAVKAGARISTHLGNGSHATLPRHDNYIWEQLAADELWASVITDGHHLPASVVKTIVRTKTPSRTVLTCDASSLAGLPPGRYLQWGGQIDVGADGRVGVAGTPFLAGSGVFTDACIGPVIAMAGVSLREAIEMVTDRPRELMGLPPLRLEVGQSGPFMLFDWEPGSALRVARTIG